jgi:replicative DNA helicase
MTMTQQAPTHGTHEPQERLLPHNTEAELAVLDSIAIDPAALPMVVDLLEPRDFYATGHAAIYAAMLALHNREEVVDTVTLMDELERTGDWQDVSPVVYRLGLNVPNSGSVLHYARIVRRCARNRALIAAAGKIAKLAYHDADDDATCDLAMREILAVMQRGSTSGQTRTKSFAEVVDEMAADVLARLDADEPIGLPTGFAELDKRVVSLEPGDLVYLAGRPGSGKSALGLKIALMAALHCYTRGAGTVDVVTLEMSAKQQARRLVADYAEINTRYIRAGFRPAGQVGGDPDMDAWAAFDEMHTWLKERAGDRLYLTEGVVSMSYLRSLIQRAVTERQCRLVVIDQLDLFADGQDRDEYERITKMSRQLKQIARSCGVVIICLVQLNRNCEARRNKRPMLSDLRQSGQLEQDADMVWGLYRPVYYDPERGNEESPDFDAQFAQLAELLLLKGRDSGSGAMVPLRFEAEYTRFKDWPFSEIPEDPTRTGAE